MKILVMDDDPGSLRLVAIHLAWGGHEVLEAEDGEAGWEIFQKVRPRLIITDWMMPNLDGVGFIQRLRANPGPSYTYIIVLTALDTKTNVISGLDAGADDYLTKPFDGEELLARIRIGERILRLEESLTASRQQMEYLAMHDTLTGLLNRRALQDRADAELNRATRTNTFLSVILLDVDHFKRINDRHGHAVGDQALQWVAGLITQHVRTYDWAGRWGGEEFLIVLPNTTLSEAGRVAERIREALALSYVPLAAQELSLTASLGVAARPAPKSLHELTSRADAALYRAKNQGRNQVCLADGEG